MFAVSTRNGDLTILWMWSLGTPGACIIFSQTDLTNLQNTFVTDSRIYVESWYSCVLVIINWSIPQSLHHQLDRQYRNHPLESGNGASVRQCNWCSPTWQFVVTRTAKIPSREHPSVNYVPGEVLLRREWSWYTLILLSDTFVMVFFFSFVYFGATPYVR